jgi:hypothetical protein
MKYIGPLSEKDPLYGYLRHDIFPQVGIDSTAHADPQFHPFAPSTSLNIKSGSGNNSIGIAWK